METENILKFSIKHTGSYEVLNMGNEILLMPIVSNDSKASQKAVVINELGKIIWDLIDGKKSVEVIIENIFSKYQVDYIVLQNDITKFIKFLVSLEAIKICEFIKC